MSTPTPDEITAAHALLLRVPGFTGSTTLDEVAEIETPTRLFAHAVRAWFSEDRINDFEVEAMLAKFAAHHGLRITTDPGELGGYLLASACKRGSDDAWKPAAYGRDSYPPNPSGLAEAREHCDGDRRVAALYLLPESGNA